MRPSNVFIALLTITLATTASASADGIGQAVRFSGNLRLGYVDHDEGGQKSHAAAIGGRITTTIPVWRGLRAGGTAYTSQKSGAGENGEFFSSDGDGYSIVGQAWIAAEFGGNTLKAGRFSLETPHADSDDIRMIPNNFQGVLFTNASLPGATFHAIHLDKWSGVDSDTPEKFTALSGGGGVNAIGVVYDGIENLSLQAWHYDASDFARLTYAEALYESGHYQFGVQLGWQSNRAADKSGPDATINGLMAGASIGDFTFTAAYNKVFGTATNGFGGGPWFTSADDHTIADVENQEAISFTAEYAPTEQLSFYVRNTHLHHGEDETDYSVSFAFSEDVVASFTDHDMHSDGHIALFRLDMEF